MILRSGPSFPDTIRQYIVYVMKNQPIHVPDSELEALVRGAMASQIFKADEDEILPLVQGEKVCVLAGLGEKPEALSARRIGTLTKNALLTKPLSPMRPAAIFPWIDDEFVLRAIVDGAQLGLYKWDKYITKTEEQKNQPEWELFIQTGHAEWVDLYSTVCDGVNLARDLGNENAQIITTEYLAGYIENIAKSDSRCTVEILGRPELEAKGLNLHLAVCQGSMQEPKLVIVTYKGGREDEPFIALVGKGITFDTGGINLKSTGSVEAMRMDMCGAAAVIGTLQNTLKLNIPRNAYFACGLAENAIGPKSYRPGDVFTSYCGKTVEINNTDAEGRLVLADANSYMARNYKPEAIVNIATLTGAVVIALGYEYTGLMSSHQDLADRLLQAAAASDDRAWQMPIYPELKEHIKSKYADIKNTGEPRCAGTISAGEFLRQFAQCDSEDLKWAHLDIAGTAKPQKDVGYLSAFATGVGVRLFTEFLRGE